MASDTAELPDVTVIAPRPPAPQELAGDAVATFISSHAAPSVVLHQLTRWRVGICPLIQGLSPAFNAFVSARIVAVAVAVGAPHEDTEQCRHNVEIFFTLEPQKLLDEIVKRDARLIGFHYSPQEKRLATFRHPVQGWYVTSTRNYKGQEAMDNPLPLPAVDPTNIFESGRVPPGQPGSRLTSLRNSLIVNALIIVDANKITSMTIGSISDYLAMLVLSQAKSPDSCSQLPSIMDLMATACGDKARPTQITAGDIAFLRALYSADLEQPLSLEQSDIQNHMMRQFRGR
jgi:hypothetical protein